jgi:transcriptional regulator with XRE-family HTH domain
MSFGERLRKAREAKKLTQDELGKGLGAPDPDDPLARRKDAGKQVVLGWEKGRHYPKVDQLTLICQRLGVSADYLVFGVETSALSPDALALARFFDASPSARRLLLETARFVRDASANDVDQPDRKKGNAT